MENTDQLEIVETLALTAELAGAITSEWREGKQPTPEEVWFLGIVRETLKLLNALETDEVTDTLDGGDVAHLVEGWFAEALAQGREDEANALANLAFSWNRLEFLLHGGRGLKER